jgi:hypothetical protein
MSQGISYCYFSTHVVYVGASGASARANAGTYARASDAPTARKVRRLRFIAGEIGAPDVSAETLRDPIRRPRVEVVCLAILLCRAVLLAGCVLAVGDADARPDPFVQNQHLDHLRPFTDTHKILHKLTSPGASQDQLCRGGKSAVTLRHHKD